MPQTYPLLRAKFWGKDSVGGARYAESILRDAGYQLHTRGTGSIIPPTSERLKDWTRGEILDALEYLLEEWDYEVVTP